jgi:hypothetical protein
MSNIENFKAWYVDVLVILYPRRDAGVAVLMISLPLPERYLRRKRGLRPHDNMTDAAMDGLRGMFTALPSVPTRGRLEDLSQWIPTPSDGVEIHTGRGGFARWLAYPRHS